MINVRVGKASDVKILMELSHGQDTHSGLEPRQVRDEYKGIRIPVKCAATRHPLEYASKSSTELTPFDITRIFIKRPRVPQCPRPPLIKNRLIYIQFFWRQKETRPGPK